MCGVPHQAVDHHVAKLVAAGRKVAICDQVEDPRAARGLVRRDITRVVTPGTVLDPESLVPSAPSYLAALVPGAAEWGVAFLDLSTGRFRAGAVPAPRVEDALALFRPREILLPEEAPVAGVPGRPVAPREPRGGPPRARGPARAVGGRGRRGHYAVRDAARRDRARRGAGPALVRPPDGPRRVGRRHAGALRIVGRLRRAQPLRHSRPHAHAPGARGRCGRLWRIRPSIRSTSSRAGTPWTSSSAVRRSRRGCRRLSRASATSNGDSRGSPSGRRVRGRWPPSAPGFGPRPAVADAAGPLLAGRFRFAARDDPGHVRLRRGDRVDPGSGASRARFGGRSDPRRRRRRARRAARAAARRAERHPRDRGRGAPPLRASRRVKVRFNRVFGYSLEVSNAHRDKVPADWIRKQSLANAERYFTTGAEGARGEDPRRRGPDRRDRGPPLRSAARGARARRRPRPARRPW